MKVFIEPEAEVEIENAAAWYQQEAPGLGNTFIRAVQTAVALLGRQPAIYAVAYGRVGVFISGIFHGACFTKLTPIRWPSWPACISTATRRIGRITD